MRRSVAIALVSAIVVAGCQPDRPQTSDRPAATAIATSAAPVVRRGAGDDLKILYWQAPTMLNPYLSTEAPDLDAARLVLEPLASWGRDGKPLANGLALEIPTVANGGVSPDATTVTWKLRPGLKWSDGTDFTAEDVAFTYELSKSLPTTPDNIQGVRSITAKDKNTVVVTYSASNPNLYQWGVGGRSLILQKAQFGAFVGEKVKDAPGNLKPIGTGPYKVVEFKAGVVAYAMNENFREPSKPYFKTVTFRGGGDPAASARALFQTGEVDYAWNLQVESSVLKAMADLSTKGRLVTAYGTNVERLLINFSDPSPTLGDRRGEPDTKHPFFNGPDGKLVRTALAMATDRKIPAQQIYGDAGKPGCNVITGIPEYESANTAALCSRFDPAAAAKMLDDAGWKLDGDGVRAKGGVRLNILYQTTLNSSRQKMQDAQKANWERAGFKVELRLVPSAVFFTNQSPDGASHFWADVEMFSRSSESPDFTNYLSAWTTEQIASKANEWKLANYQRYANPEFDAVVDQLRREVDPKKRAELFIKANDILVLDVVVISLAARAQVVSGVSGALKNVVPTGWDSEMHGIQDWAN